MDETVAVNLQFTCSKNANLQLDRIVKFINECSKAQDVNDGDVLVYLLEQGVIKS